MYIINPPPHCRIHNTLLPLLYVPEIMDACRYDAIYLVAPTMANVDRIKADFVGTSDCAVASFPRLCVSVSFPASVSGVRVHVPVCPYVCGHCC